MTDNDSSNITKICKGRGWLMRRINEIKSLDNKSNSSQGDNPTPGVPGRGQSFGIWNENNDEDHKTFEKDKIIGPNINIPPEIEDEFFSGIEANQNVDNIYETIDGLSGNDLPKTKSFPSFGFPIVIPGKDLVACVQNDTDQTIAYVLHILQNYLNEPAKLNFDINRCEPQVVIVAHAKADVLKMYNRILFKYTKGTDIKNKFLFGDENHDKQMRDILKHGVHILNATPKRLHQFLDKGIITFSSVRFLILVGVDIMIKFKPSIEQILNHSSMPPKDVRQTFIFSATFPSEVQRMASIYLKSDYEFVSVKVTGGYCKGVLQTFKEVGRMAKKRTLLNLLRKIDDCQGTIVFVEENRVADIIAICLSEMNIPSITMHGGYRTCDQKKSLKQFKTNKMKVLVVTPSRSKRLDIKYSVTCVVNYDLPKTVEEYARQIWHTGRLGNPGKAISFFDPDCDRPIAFELVKFLKQADQDIPSWMSEHIKDNQ